MKSILVTLFCCLPFGIAGIVKASKVSSMWAVGSNELANKYSANAAKWTIIGAVAGVVGFVAALVYQYFALAR